MKKLRIYTLADSQRQEKEDIKYWTSQSIANKTETAYSLWREHCWINKEDVDAQKLWKYIRKQATHNRYHETETDLCAALTHTFDTIQNNPELVIPLVAQFC